MVVRCSLVTRDGNAPYLNVAAVMLQRCFLFNCELLILSLFSLSARCMGNRGYSGESVLLL